MSFLFLTNFLLNAALLSSYPDLRGHGSLRGVNLATNTTEEDGSRGRIGKLLLTHGALGDGDATPGSQLAAGKIVG